MQLEPTVYGIVLLFIIGVCLIILGVAQLIANKLYPVRKPTYTDKYDSDTSLTGSIDHE